MPSHLSKHIPAIPWNEAEITSAATAAFHQHGIVLLRIDDIPNDIDRQLLINLAEQKYGKRKG